MTLVENDRLRVGQKSIAFTIAYLLSFLAILNCSNAFTNAIGVHTVLDTLLLYGALWLSLIFGIWSILRTFCVKLDVLGLFVFMLLSFLLTALFYPQNLVFLYTNPLDYAGNPLYLVFLYSFTGYIFARYLHDYNMLCSYLRIFSYIVVILSIWTYFFATDSDANQYMTLSYNMLLQLIFLIYNKPKRCLVIHYSIIAAGVFVVAFGGARGALLGLLVATFFLLFSKNSTLKHKTAYAILFIGVAALVFVFFEKIIAGFVNLLDMMNISSRTLQLLLGEEDLSSQIRMNIYKMGLDNIGMFGKGLFGDRVLMQGMDDSYVHNLFLEILIDYGFIVGLALSVLIVVALIVGLKRATIDQWRLIVICIPTGFIALMVTGSYLNQAPSFYVLMGLCANVIMEGKK